MLQTLTKWLDRVARKGNLAAPSHRALHRFACLAGIAAAVIASFAIASGRLSLPGTRNALSLALSSQSETLRHLSDRAEQIRDLAPYLRKASLQEPSGGSVHFAGFIGPNQNARIGARLRLASATGAPYVLRVVSSERMPPSLAITAPGARRMDLMLITGIVVNDDNMRNIEPEQVRLMVAVDPQSTAAAQPSPRPRHEQHAL